MDSFKTGNLASSPVIKDKVHVLRVGLTGGIGSGKSTVARFLEKLGAVVIDTDVISHEITSHSGLAMGAIREVFGKKIIAQDGSLDRPKMRSLIFDNPSLKLALEDITHPLIRKIAEDLAGAALQQNPPYIVFVVPLLLESEKWLGQIPKKIDYVVVIDSSVEHQIARVQSRSNMNLLSIQKIIATQATREDKLAVADYVLENNSTQIELEKKTAQLHELLLKNKNQ